MRGATRSDGWLPREASRVSREIQEAEAPQWGPGAKDPLCGVHLPPSPSPQGGLDVPEERDEVQVEVPGCPQLHARRTFGGGSLADRSADVLHLEAVVDVFPRAIWGEGGHLQPSRRRETQAVTERQDRQHPVHAAGPTQSASPTSPA